jgi:hypothetical protein
MGKIIVQDEKVQLHGKPPYTLPEDLTSEVCEDIITTDVGGITFLGKFAELIPWAERTRLRDVCKQVGGDVYKSYCTQASMWAGILNKDCHWHLEAFQILQESQLNIGAVARILVTATNLRFVELLQENALLTFAEFRYKFGTTIQEYVGVMKRDIVSKFDQVLSYMDSTIIVRNVLVRNEKGEQMKVAIPTLEAIPVDDMSLPIGYQLIKIISSNLYWNSRLQSMGQINIL